MPETNKYQYCMYNNEVLELHVLEEEFYKNQQVTRNKYRGQLLCPGCRQVRLSIHENSNSNSIYLAAYPNSHHTENCEYLLNSATKRELKVFYDQIAPDRAEQMLERILEDRVAVLNLPQNQNPNDDVDEDDDGNYELTNENGTRKYLPRRSLQLRKMEESDHLVMYYGECRLFIAQDKWDNFYLRLFRNDETRYYLCSLKIPIVVFNYLRDELNFIPCESDFDVNNSKEKSVPARIAFISTIEEKSLFFNGKITHSKLLKVIQL
jgi:hypothetical protein